MRSRVDWEQNFGEWTQNNKWLGVFKINWLIVKDVQNKFLRHIHFNM